jgi:hypothetical protein
MKQAGHRVGQGACSSTPRHCSVPPANAVDRALIYVVAAADDSTARPAAGPGASYIHIGVDADSGVRAKVEGFTLINLPGSSGTTVTSGINTRGAIVGS